MSETDSGSDRVPRWLADCPACTRGLGVIEELKDKTIRCPVCGEVFSLARKRAAPVAPEELPDSAERVVVVRAQKRRPAWYRRVRIPAGVWTALAIAVVMLLGWVAYERLKPPPTPPERAPKVVLKKVRVIGTDRTRHQAEITAIARNPVCTRVLVGDRSGTVIQWNLETGEIEKRLDVGGPVVGLVYLPDAQHFLVAVGPSPGGSGAGRCQRWSLDDGRPDQVFPVQKTVARLAADPARANVLVACDGESTFDVLSIAGARRVHTFEGHEGPIAALAFDADGRFCASGSQDQTARLWDAQTGAPVASFGGHEGTVTAVAVSSPTGQVLTGEMERILRAFDRQSTKQQWRVPALEDPVYDLAIDPTGRWVVARAGKVQVGFWFLPSGEPCVLEVDGEAVKTVDRTDSPIVRLAYWPEFHRLALATASGRIELYAVQTEQAAPAP